MKSDKEFVNRVTEHIPRLRIFARTLTRDVPGAEDLLQDSLERAFRKFHLWDRNGNLRAWLFTMMRNIFINQYRKEQNQPLMDSLEDTSEPLVREDNDLAHDLNYYLDQLSLEQREIIFLVCLEQLQYEEVAESLSIPVGTVMSRLSRARAKLKKVMQTGSDTTLRVVK